MRNHRRAFTLIELLVVIAIIAILAAILFPVFAQAKLSAKKAVSISNVKELGLAEKIYEGDYDDTIPVSQYCGIRNDPTTLITWEQELYPYIKNGKNGPTGSFGTGNGSDVRDKTEGIFADPAAPDLQSFPYGIHRNLSPDNWSQTCNNDPAPILPGTIATIIPSPADTIFVTLKGRTESSGVDKWGWIYMLADEYGWANTVGPFDAQGNALGDNGTLALDKDCDGPSGGAGPQWNSCGEFPRYRYSKVCPIVFNDGHAKAMSRGSVKFAKNVWVPGLAANGGNSLW